MTPERPCARCRKAISADKKHCSTCATIESPQALDIGPAALAALLEGGGGTCHDPADGGGGDCGGGDGGGD